MTLLKHGTCNSSIIHVEFFNFLLRFFKSVESTGFEKNLFFKFEFIVGFDSPVIPFLDIEEVMGPI